VTSNSGVSTPNTYFNVRIWDHVRWDASVFLRPAEQPAAGRPENDAWLKAALAIAAYCCNNRRVEITDLDLASYRYGGDPDRWPRVVRAKVRQALTGLIPEVAMRRCPGGSCEWRGHRHRHWEGVLPDALCGAVTALAADCAEDDPDCAEPDDESYPLDFTRRLPRRKDLEKFKARLADLRCLHDEVSPGGAAERELAAKLERLTACARQAEQGLGDRLRPVYLPALLLGRAAGLTRLQTYLLTSLACELTRRRGRNKRADRARRFTAGASATPCPFLTHGQEYVAFDGQGNFRGRYRGAGYRLVVRASNACYTGAATAAPRRVNVACRRYLRDLASLHEEFGLVVAFRCRDDVWRSLEEALQLSRSTENWRLRDALVHVYGPADYAERWGRILRGRARVERRGIDCPHNRVEKPGVVRHDGTWLRAWLEKLGLSLRQAAREIGVSPSYLSMVRSGKRPLSPALKTKAERCAEVLVKKTGGGPDVVGTAGGPEVVMQEYPSGPVEKSCDADVPGPALG
jgi:hypothetical protein